MDVARRMTRRGEFSQDETAEFRSQCLRFLPSCGVELQDGVSDVDTRGERTESRREVDPRRGQFIIALQPEQATVAQADAHCQLWVKLRSIRREHVPALVSRREPLRQVEP